VRQWAENEHRSGLSTSDKLLAIEQLSLLGLSPAKIAKPIRTRRQDVTDALTAAGSELAKGATQRWEFLTLDQAAAVAEFSDLIRARTREGMAVAKAKGRLWGKRPKLTPSQERHLVDLHRAGAHTGAELAELFNVARSTVYRAVARAGVPPPAAWWSVQRGRPPLRAGTRVVS